MNEIVFKNDDKDAWFIYGDLLKEYIKGNKERFKGCDKKELKKMTDKGMHILLKELIELMDKHNFYLKFLTDNFAIFSDKKNGKKKKGLINRTLEFFWK